MDPGKSLDEAQAEVAAKPFPRVTETSIRAKIDRVEYWNPPGSTFTVAVIFMVNGFCFVGKSGAADARAFDAEIGKRFAFEDALKQIWSHEGYLLREHLSRSESS